MASRATSLFDIWGPCARCAERIPFDIFEAPHYFRHDKQEGVDFAVVALPELVLRLLAQTTVPFTKANWIHQADIAFDFFGMLGLPNEEAEQSKTNENGINSVTTFQNPTLLFVKPCELPSNMEASRQPQFVARINDRADLKSIVGMSGGPIFGFGRTSNGQLAYWPVAIQSRWLPDSRIVIASYLAPIAADLEAWFQAIIDDSLT